jgi:hypothetical protein
MMTQNLKTILSKDIANKKILATREFAAPVEKVWAAWTQKELLDQWWAPRPWKAETKSMNFEEGNYWLYCMVGPAGEKAWCRVNFISIAPTDYFSGESWFCDEEGSIDNNFPSMVWKNNFQPSAIGTQVTVELTFENEEDLKKIIEMGFEQGFTMAHSNLDELLAK